MGESLTELVQSLVEKPLKTAIRRAAFEHEKSVSAEIRDTLRAVYLPDDVTLEMVAPSPALVDSRVPYETATDETV